MKEPGHKSTISWRFVAHTSTAVFLAYMCMYMFRKPYAAGSFENMLWHGIDLKIVLVVSQILGYALSKFIGIKIISELKPNNRIKLFLSFLLIALLALLGLSQSSPSWSPLWMFINGIPLGMIWGIVFSFCEGRRSTEILTVILASNFLIASGLAKSIGHFLLKNGISEFQMPFLVGTMTIPVLVLVVWMLSKIPPPTPEEQEHRSSRPAMGKAERRALLKTHWMSISLFVLFYILLTTIRDIRDNYAVELWASMDYSESSSVLISSELPIALVILIALGLLYRINDHYKALLTYLLISTGGMIILLLSTYFFSIGALGGYVWMMISGAGIFLPYILLNGIIYDRFIAHHLIVGNVGFIMYISDAFGYLSSVTIMIIKSFGFDSIPWLDYYVQICLYGGMVAIAINLLLILSHLGGQKNTITKA